MTNTGEMTETELIDDWRLQIEMIRRDLTALNHHRSKMERIFSMVNANERLLAHPGRMILSDWRMYYGTWVLVMLRRETDKSDNSISLRTLLDSLAENAHVLTTAQVRRLWKDPRGQYTSISTSWPFLQDSQAALDPAQPLSDAAALDDMSGGLRRFVNKMVAHRSNTDALPPAPTFDELDSLANAFERIAKPYILLLTGASFRFDVVEQFGWMDVFDFAWRGKP